ncbi:hypothetical protein SUSAZ_08440 [Sulfolobus acidocaldarius SUSAZ]|nr:hypothetical protein SUSAZ_08440 [Sulfolobus acidocaldarius SUSAZ]
MKKNRPLLSVSIGNRDFGKEKSGATISELTRKVCGTECYSKLFPAMIIQLRNKDVVNTFRNYITTSTYIGQFQEVR